MKGCAEANSYVKNMDDVDVLIECTDPCHKRILYKYRVTQIYKYKFSVYYI